MENDFDPPDEPEEPPPQLARKMPHKSRTRKAWVLFSTIQVRRTGARRRGRLRTKKQDAPRRQITRRTAVKRANSKGYPVTLASSRSAALQIREDTNH